MCCSASDILLRGGQHHIADGVRAHDDGCGEVVDVQIAFEVGLEQFAQRVAKGELTVGGDAERLRDQVGFPEVAEHFVVVEVSGLHHGLRRLPTPVLRGLLGSALRCVEHGGGAAVLADLNDHGPHVLGISGTDEQGDGRGVVVVTSEQLEGGILLGHVAEHGVIHVVETAFSLGLFQGFTSRCSKLLQVHFQGFWQRCGSAKNQRVGPGNASESEEVIIVEVVIHLGDGQGCPHVLVLLQVLLLADVTQPETLGLPCIFHNDEELAAELLEFSDESQEEPGEHTDQNAVCGIETGVQVPALVLLEYGIVFVDLGPETLFHSVDLLGDDLKPSFLIWENLVDCAFREVLEQIDEVIEEFDGPVDGGAFAYRQSVNHGNAFDISHVHAPLVDPLLLEQHIRALSNLRSIAVFEELGDL